ncbi:hypothetical protein NKW84_13975 [Acetobacter senegalensis]|nr:hypothetical protein [Acetobacter senegalensis]MCP1196960.1 hypothetical protein [Acetobacter senegalensis]
MEKGKSRSFWYVSLRHLRGVRRVGCTLLRGGKVRVFVAFRALVTVTE